MTKSISPERIKKQRPVVGIEKAKALRSAKAKAVETEDPIRRFEREFACAAASEKISVVKNYAEETKQLSLTSHKTFREALAQVYGALMLISALPKAQKDEILKHLDKSERKRASAGTGNQKGGRRARKLLPAHLLLKSMLKYPQESHNARHKLISRDAGALNYAVYRGIPTSEFFDSISKKGEGAARWSRKNSELNSANKAKKKNIDSENENEAIIRVAPKIEEEKNPGREPEVSIDFDNAELTSELDIPNAKSLKIKFDSKTPHGIVLSQEVGRGRSAVIFGYFSQSGNSFVLQRVNPLPSRLALSKEVDDLMDAVRKASSGVLLSKIN